MSTYSADYPLRRHNTLALPAVAEFYGEAGNLDQLEAARRFAQERRLPLTVLGEGSNVVLGERIAGLVVRLVNADLKVKPLDGRRVRLTVGAGHNWHRLVEHSLQQGWFGLENLALIPGTAGAAPIQNIGAYGVELERFLHGVQALEVATGERVRFSAAECQLAYRDSIFKGRYRDRFIIHAVELELSTVAAPVLGYPAVREHLEQNLTREPEPRDVFEAVCRIRREKLPDPAVTPNAGSFFKNPIVTADTARQLLRRYPDMATFPVSEDRTKLAAAWLIDRAGWKGVLEGEVGVHDRQALVLFNRGAAGAGELLALARKVAASVRERFGVELEMEPRCYGCRF